MKSPRPDAEQFRDPEGEERNPKQPEAPCPRGDPDVGYETNAKRERKQHTKKERKIKWWKVTSEGPITMCLHE